MLGINEMVEGMEEIPECIDFFGAMVEWIGPGVVEGVVCLQIADA
jgi:hypothetical protein